MKNKKIIRAFLASMLLSGVGMKVDAIWQLDEVNVIGDKYDADIAQVEPIASGLIGTVQEVGTLGKKDVLSVPFQQMTFTKQTIDTFSHPNRSAMDALSLSPSVTVTHGSLDTNVKIRGFSAGSGSWLINGVPSMSHQMTMPTNYFDKIEVLAGPNLGVNGIGIFMANSVGGTISATTKKAQEMPILHAGLSWAGKTYFTKTIDWGSRISNNKQWGIRINALHGNGKLVVSGTKDTKYDIAINIDHVSKNGDSNIFFSYDHDEQWGRNNTIGLGKLESIPVVPNNKNNLSPHWIDEKYQNYTFIANHKQKISDNLIWFTNFGWRWEDYCKDLWGRRTLKDLKGNYTGAYQETPVFHHYTYFGTGIKGGFDLGQWKDELNIGFGFTRFSRARNNLWSKENTYIVSGNIYKDNDTPAPVIVWDPITPHQKMFMRSVTLTNTIISPNGKLNVTFGLHRHEIAMTNYVNKTYMKTHAVSPLLGVIYKLNPNCSVYANHGEHFIAGSTVNGKQYINNGEILSPSKTKQNEFGFKYKDDSRMYTLSLFEIKQANIIDVINSQPIDKEKGIGILRKTLDGEQKYRGVELFATGSIGEKFSYIWGISYLDAKQIKTQNGKNDGRMVNALPSWSSDVAIVYKPNNDFRAIGRVSYTGETSIRNSISYKKNLKIGDQILIDMGISWDTYMGKYPVTLSAWCYNLFDKHYWYAVGENDIGIGAPRTFTFLANFRI